MSRSKRVVLAVLGWLSFFPFGLNAQSGLTLVGTGHPNPAILNVAPGEVTTLFVSGATTVLPATPPYYSVSQAASQLPLPTSLAGFSALITQQPGSYAVALPLLSVEQDNRCPQASTVSGACLVTGITVQIPYDLYVDPSHTRPQQYTTAITISQAGAASNVFDVNAVPENVHVLTTCDSGLNAGAGDTFPSACQALITHTDGSLVSVSSPAQAGEILVMYAYGLGSVANSTAVAGSASPNTLSVTQASYGLTFAYRGSGIGTEQGPGLAVSTPLYAGLTPGQVGLYQINFQVAAPSGPIINCNNQDGANLLVTVMNGISPSTDTARVCVSSGS